MSCRAAADSGTETSKLKSEPCNLNVLTWNILAKRWADQCFADGEYPLATSTDIAWSNRCPRILAMILASDADVVLLQEVDTEAFCQDLEPKLKAAGYRGLHQKGNKHPCNLLAGCSAEASLVSASQPHSSCRAS